ncbi:hypothetical protein I545_0372 [Mycobacterium kansasii 662]|uniref:Uncharacterized protein n=1 Tax=Mycobacterium kansasii 662 TaxID=1299326 RepID=X7ZPX9_MYCKA|nr:hypothetical protein I545_0372 [Mycobacterium kansasii 662]
MRPICDLLDGRRLLVSQRNHHRFGHSRPVEPAPGRPYL